MLNVRDANHKQIHDNAEVTNLLKILGLQYKLKYNDENELKTLRYGKIMIMADQDQDGSHIKGLLINFIHNSWPNLMKKNFIEQFITPIVKATKKGKGKGGDDEGGAKTYSFYSMPEYANWKQEMGKEAKKYTIKYYKGVLVVMSDYAG